MRLIGSSLSSWFKFALVWCSGFLACKLDMLRELLEVGLKDEETFPEEMLFGTVRFFLVEKAEIGARPSS